MQTRSLYMCFSIWFYMVSATCQTIINPSPSVSTSRLATVYGQRSDVFFNVWGGNIGHQLPETTFRHLGCLVLALLSLQLSGKNPFLIRSQKSHQPSISFHFLDNSSLGCQENIFTSPSFCDLPPQVMFLHGLLEDFLMCTTVCRSSRMGFMHSLASSKPFLVGGFNHLDTYESQLGRMTSHILFFHSIYYPIYYGK